MALACYLRLIPPCEKKEFFSQIRLLHTREQVWSMFKAMASPCTQAGPREHWAAEGLHVLGIREAKVGNRLGWLSRANPYWDQCSITE